MLVGLFVVGALLAGWPSQGPSAGASTAASHTTPLLSPRRVPALVARTVGDDRLARALELALNDPALGPGRELSCLVVESGRRVLFERRADLSLLPASNLKLLTGAAVLSELGADTRLRTSVRGALGPDGVVHGDLWLVGGGDPLLATGDYVAVFRRQPQVHTPLEELARRVRAAGVTTVTGSVRGDESRYDTERYLPTWKAGYLTDNEIGPMSALTVNDGFAAFRPRRVRADRPATHAAAVFTQLLRSQGVTVTGEPAEGRVPASVKQVATIDSLPVRDLVAQMLRESDNMTSELLVKEVARHAGRPASTGEGLEEVEIELAGERLPTAGVELHDGSGLDRANRATCAAVQAVLRDDGPTGPLAVGLPIANRSGTLLDRFVGSPAAGKVRAKTGSLDEVSAFSGFAEGRQGTLTFSLLLNGLTRDAMGPITWERVAAALVAYPDAPDPADLAPLP